MMSQVLQLPASVNHDTATALTRTLGAVKGVNHVGLAPTGNRISITFDEDVTSEQELAAALHRAGYVIGSAQHGHNEGGCCGGGCS